MSAIPDDLAPLRLKKNEERRLRAGHVWVYSNEVDIRATPLKTLEPGQPVDIQMHGGKSLGTGYVNPGNLICARLVSRNPAHRLDRSLVVHRLNIALSIRERLFADPFYRLVYGESDGLPGLIVDRYGDYVVVQLTTAGMERARDVVFEALDKVLRPRGVLFRNDSPGRSMEGLESYIEAIGDIPETIEVLENNLRFRVSVREGQKTGWFYDQRMNRLRLADYVAGMRVLDMFSYTGAWGVRAAVAGAREVLCVDSSERANQAAQQNAELNNVDSQLTIRKGDAFEVMSSLRESGEKFDMVILDPPAFIKRKKDIKAGEQAYHRINQLGMRLLSRDGILISASCSQHMSENNLQKILLRESRHLDRQLQILERGHQGPDHPVHPAISETSYLKAMFCRIIPA